MTSRYTPLASVMIIAALLSSFPSSARAEEFREFHLTLFADDVANLALDDAGIQGVQRTTPFAPPVPRECTPRYMAGPGMGIALGPGAMVSGIFMTGAGALRGFWDAPLAPADKALIAGGAIVIAAGAATLAYSIGKLVRNRKKRKRVCTSDTPQ